MVSRDLIKNEFLTISIVIPAFNEIENLRILLPEIRNQTRDYNDVEVLVVLPTTTNNNEKEEVYNLSATPVIRAPGNTFGDAIRSGIKNVRSVSNYVIFMDADGSHNPKTIPRLIDEVVANNVDIVIASRYIDGGSTDNSLVLRAMSKILNYVFALVLGLKIKDISTNFKIYKRELLLDSKLVCKNYDIVEEILLEAKKIKPNLKVLEIPDHFHERVYGESKRKLSVFIATYLATLIRLRFRK
jgi:dolichol-phosphate mannosyltransferase